MTKILLALAVLFFATPAFAQDTYVNGYYRQNGTYVQPHYRSAPDSNPYNNYSARGNVNPYNGNVGTHNPQPSYNPPTYGGPGPSAYQNPNSYSRSYNSMYGR